MKLFGYYRSSASYRIRIILNLKGLPWDYEAVLLNRGEQKTTDYLAKNPSGLVPVLEHDGHALAQSPAIAEYIEEMFPDPPLLPENVRARAQVRELLAVIGCDIHPLQNLRVLNWIKDEFGADDKQVRQWIHRWIGGGFTAFEQLLSRGGSNGRYCHGDQPGLADAWLIPQVYNARRHEMDLEPYPLIRAIDAHCLTLPAFANAVPEAQPDAPA